MAKVFYFVGWIGLAVAMATAGITVTSWQFWAIEASAAVIVIARALW